MTNRTSASPRRDGTLLLSLGALVGALSLTLAGCCTDPVTGRPYFCLREVSDADEGTIGAWYAPNFIAQSGGRYPDPALYDYLNDIVMKMARSCERSHLTWTFEILNTSVVNAFALPGGRVFVTRGLLSRLDTEAQFAHLMGHEIGHVTHRHALRGQGRQALLGVVMGTLAAAEQGFNVLVRDPDDPLFVTGTANFIVQVPFLKFSRDQEIQSDERGVDYAYRAGYDPREAVKTFEVFLKMKEESGRWNQLILALLSTHPLDRTRIRNLDQYIEKTYPEIDRGDAELKIDREGWPAHLARVKEAQLVYDKYDEGLELLQQSESEEDPQKLEEAAQRFEAAAAALPKHATMHVGLALVAYQREDKPSTLEHLSHAIEIDDRHYQARLLRGVVYREQERYDEALDDLLDAYDLFPASPIPCFQIGQTTEAQGRSDSAIEWYKKAIRRAPKGSPVLKKARARVEALENAEA